MKAARWVLVAVILVWTFALAGCAEREAQEARIRWVPTGTGWYQPSMEDIVPQTGK